MPEVIIYTDGACSGNPGPGGWGSVLICGDYRKEISGGEKHTTNQRMELLAALEALRLLKKTSTVVLYSDSAYLINAFQNGWLIKWQTNGWLNAQKKPVENQDIWRPLWEISHKHEISWQKVKGHAGNTENERCDLLARQAIKTLL